MGRLAHGLFRYQPFNRIGAVLVPLLSDAAPSASRGRALRRFCQDGRNSCDSSTAGLGLSDYAHEELIGQTSPNVTEPV